MSNEKPRLSWTSHPFVDYPITSILLAIVLITIAVLLWQIAVVQWNTPLFYILPMFILFATLLPYFIPTTYQFFESKITIYYLFVKVERRYSEFGCFYADKKGVMLSTFQQPRRLDSFRGQSIRFSKTKKEKEALFDLLEEKIGKKA